MAAGDKFALLDEDDEQLTHMGRSLADDDFKAVRLSQSKTSILNVQNTPATHTADKLHSEKALQKAVLACCKTLSEREHYAAIVRPAL